MKIVPLSLAVMVMVLGGCGSQPQVSFQNDVMPLLKRNCLECHVKPAGTGYQASGLSMESYADLMKGTKYGPIVIAGSSLNSTLMRLVAGKADPSLRMPHNRPSLSAAEQETVRLWIDQGAKDN